MSLDGVEQLFIKRDDLTASPYGGNKVRKLEFLLADAQDRGARRVVTFGYAGSNHALATALYSPRAGLHTTSILLPQPNAHYVRRNLLAAHAAGAKLVARSRVSTIALTVAAIEAMTRLTGAPRPYIIPAGGSSPIGVMGYVNAAFELADQIVAGSLPRPDRIYLSLGSMGTTAGLAIGFALAGLPIEIHAIRVVDTRFGSREKLDQLVKRTYAFMKSRGMDFPDIDPLARIVIRDEFFGNRYGEFTASGVDAVLFARDTADIRLDGTYSGKAFAALLADAKSGALRGKNILFWNTHNSHDVDTLARGTSYRVLLKTFHHYFTNAVQPMDPGA